VQTSNISELQALCFFSFVHSPSVLCKSAVNKGITPYLGPSLLATLVPSATVSSANMGMRKSALLLFSFFFYSCWTIKRDMNSQLSSVCVCVRARVRALGSEPRVSYMISSCSHWATPPARAFFLPTFSVLFSVSAI
jgi:hypothetical protein